MLFSSSNFIMQEGQHVFEYSPDDKELYILYNGEVLDEVIECNKHTVKDSSFDGSVSFISVKSGKDNPETTDKNEEETKYYIIDKTNVTELPKPEKEFVYDILSADGETIFCTETKTKDDGKIDTTYYLYDISGEEKTEIKFEGKVNESSLLPSRNFESFLYVSTKGEGEEKTEALYLYADGENTKLGSDMTPVLVSDNAKYVYASATQKGEGDKYTTTLYYFDGEEKIKIKSDYSGIARCNEDCSQILFGADGKLFFYENGEEEAVKIANGSFSDLVTPDSEHTVRVKDLRGVPVKVRNDGAIGVYVISDDPNEIEKIASDVDDCKLTADGKTMYFTKKNTLRCVEINDASTEETLAEAESEKTTLSFYMSKDGSDVYYEDNNTLYYLEGPKEKTRVAEDVASIRMTSDDLLLYLTKDKILYATDSADKGEKIDDDVYNIEVSIGTTIYYADINTKKGTATAFYSDGGDSFENIKSGKEFSIYGISYEPNYEAENTIPPSVDYDSIGNALPEGWQNYVG
jgi:hypothetical protein